MCNCIEIIKTKLDKELECDGKVKTNWKLLEDGTLMDFPAGLEFVYHRKKKDGTLETKQRSVSLMPMFCPFCGKPYNEKNI
jgi:hypothetical protein